MICCVLSLLRVVSLQYWLLLGYCRQIWTHLGQNPWHSAPSKCDSVLWHCSRYTAGFVWCHRYSMCRVNVVAMDAVLSILLTRYMHVHRFMCLTQSTWKVVDWTKWQSAVEMVSWALRMWVGLLIHHQTLSCAVRCNAFPWSGADVQVVSSHCYPVVFHPFVEKLIFFYISGLIL